MPSLPHQSKFHIESLETLSLFADLFSAWLQSGDVVALNGDLGAGKTTLTQQIGRALDLKESVSSPTFVLMNEYRSGRYPIVHVDLYRLGEEKAASLAEELFAVIDEGRALVLVEWACYGSFLEPVLSASIQIDYAENEAEGRLITLSAARPLLPAFADWDGKLP